MFVETIKKLSKYTLELPRLIQLSIYTLVLLMMAILLMVTITGDVKKIDNDYFLDPSNFLHGHFENSSPRSRFALIYSMVEHGTPKLTPTLAYFSLPDLAKTPNGDFVSLFAPGTSIILSPFYYIGRKVGIPHLAVTAGVAIFALLNMVLIVKISNKLGANKIAAFLGAFVFLCATPALGYAGVVYQHHITVFLMLMSVYSLQSYKPYKALLLVWFFLAAAVVVDYPNLFLFLPIAFYALGKIILINKEQLNYVIRIKYLLIVTVATAIIPFSLLIKYNLSAFNNPYQLAGTLPRVYGINIDTTQLSESKIIDSLNTKILADKDPEPEAENKNAVGFFATRKLLNGFYIHLFSPDRGLINYAPTLMLSLLFVINIATNKNNIFTMLTAIVITNLLVYSLWGDPWGGWAFGSRYLLPTYSILAIFLAMVMQQYKQNIIIFIIFLYTGFIGINTNILGAMTTLNVPPQVEILALEKLTDKEEKYTADRGYEYLNKNISRSFFYNHFLFNNITLWDFYRIMAFIYSSILIILASINMFYGNITNRGKAK